MKIVFYKKSNNRLPVKEFILGLNKKDRAKVLACLKNVEELGFDSPRVDFRQIRSKLWEIKVKASSGFRIFYVSVRSEHLVLLHAYQKQSQKAPKNEVDIANKRMMEVFADEQDYIR